MAKAVPEEQRSVFVPFMRRSFRPERPWEPMIAIMAQRFSTRELNALTHFYGSPEGKSIVKKMPEFMADLMPILQREFLRAKDEFLRDQAAR